ncbi:MAG: hypothetical protein WBV28_05855 [Terracidiphilus sp.]
MDEKRELLRHTLATVAYRAAHALGGAPDSFATFAGVGRQPADILAHMGDLFEWALSMVKGHEQWHSSKSLSWKEEQKRFFAALEVFDAYLASTEPLHAPMDKLFQAPIADALTHVGQLAMMRRLAGAKIQGENYFVARIEIGNVGADQAAPVQSF